MPAAAVIPAPIAYAKVVAVKKLVVGFYPLHLKKSRLPGRYACDFKGYFVSGMFTYVLDWMYVKGGWGGFGLPARPNF